MATKQLKTKYLRVRVDGKTMYLEDVSQISCMGKPALKGMEVDKGGDLKTDRKGAYIQRVIHLDLITKRTTMYMSNKYGELQDTPCDYVQMGA